MITLMQDMLRKLAQTCSILLDLARSCSILLNLAQSCSIMLNHAQSRSILLRSSGNIRGKCPHTLYSIWYEKQPALQAPKKLAAHLRLDSNRCFQQSNFEGSDPRLYQNQSISTLYHYSCTLYHYFTLLTLLFFSQTWGEK